MPADTLVLRVPPARARAVALETMEAEGWRLQEEAAGSLVFSRGKRGRTILIGGLSGRSLHLTARLLIAPSPEGSEVRYVGDARSGRMLGGLLGERRARRTHRRAVRALEERFQRSGVLRGAPEDDPDRRE